MTIHVTTVEALEKGSTFSYTCNRCKRCCTNLEISVNPYDIARLAQHQGISTTEFIASYVDVRKQSLKRQTDGTCIFLVESGCSVHPDRPLPCRLYPLARNITGSGKEIFVALPLDSDSKGEFGNTGIVNDYLKSQEVELHLRFADEYFSFFRSLLVSLQQNGTADEAIRDLMLEHLSIQKQLLGVPERAALVAELSDLDKFLATYCIEQNIPEPRELTARAELHLKALDQILKTIGIAG